MTSLAANTHAGTEVTARGPAGTLHGTLESPPSKDAPVVLIIPGSGPTDRDGNSPLGIKAAPYRLLAEALSAKGIASVRVDKRGLFGSQIEGFDPNKVTIDDYAADVSAWVSAQRERTGQRCIWVLGHSEGALVAVVAAAHDPHICGLVLASGAGRNIADVMIEQLKSNPANAPILPQALGAIADLRAGKHVDTSAFPAPLQPLFRPAVQDFLISMFSYDPSEVLKKSKQPVLVVQGTTDLQTSMEDAKRLAGARAGVTLVPMEGMNHVWKDAPSERAANIATYGNPDLPLHAGLADAIADFVRHGK